MKVPILIPNIFNHPFTYESNFKLNLGDYVEVPFGNTKATGVVWDEFEKKSNALEIPPPKLTTDGSKRLRIWLVKIPKLFPSVSMIRYEDDTELKNI